MYTYTLFATVLHREEEKVERVCDPTVRMPHLPQKPHTRWRQRIILRELQLRRENTTLERRALWSLDERLPIQQVIFGHRAGGYAFWWIVGQKAVFMEEAALCGC